MLTNAIGAVTAVAPTEPCAVLPIDDAEPLPVGWAREDAPGWGQDGNQLHGMGSATGGVPITSWCVTFKDLTFLRQCLQKAIADGEITATDRDKFDKSDDVVGPNMYTTCDQYIKPLTRRAGSMSWALMRNPKGVRCDLFITHAWIEGMYEFIDKVLHSWPRGKKSCYVCLLSNPQNLDISALISSPQSSPFALCLTEATHMLVIPNQHSSIYSRLWCVYEAYLGYKREKIILTATPPTRRWILKNMAVTSVLLIAGSVPSFLRPGCNLMNDDEEGSGAMFLPLTMALAILAKLVKLVDWSGKRRNHGLAAFLRFPLTFAVNSFGTCLSSFTCAMAVKESAEGCKANVQPFERWMFDGTVSLSIVFVCFFVASEIDRVKEALAVDEADQLSKDFTSVFDAQCSSAVDAKNIKGEVNQEMFQVDAAVEVLKAAGMSTKTLRTASARGADVTGAGFLSIANLTYSIGFWGFLQVVYMSDGHSVGHTVAWVLGNAASCLIAVAWWLRAMPDQRAFAASVAAKVYLGAGLILRVATNDWAPKTSHARALLFELTITVSTGMAMLCAYIGMSGMARIPVCGPFLATLMGPRTRCLCCSRRSNQVSPEAYSSPPNN